jgi:hypothetical protein
MADLSHIYYCFIYYIAIGDKHKIVKCRNFNGDCGDSLKQGVRLHRIHAYNMSVEKIWMVIASK